MSYKNKHIANATNSSRWWLSRWYFLKTKVFRSHVQLLCFASIQESNRNKNVRVFLLFYQIEGIMMKMEINGIEIFMLCMHDYYLNNNLSRLKNLNSVSKHKTGIKCQNVQVIQFHLRVVSKLCVHEALHKDNSALRITNTL